jgi:hypothetical protein
MAVANWLLKGKTQECGNADSVEGIIEAFQTKFGRPKT